MWWARILNRVPSRSTGTLRLLERVISPAESHSAEPFRIPVKNTPVQPVEPVGGADYRLKRGPPNPTKQCF